ncbi:hypothetical protein [Escherichia phage PH1061]|nr:hypothetical protein [Escherichia phage PH1061]
MLTTDDGTVKDVNVVTTLLLPLVHWIPEPGRGPKVVEVEANYTLTNVWQQLWVTDDPI